MSFSHKDVVKKLLRNIGYHEWIWLKICTLFGVPCHITTDFDVNNIKFAYTKAYNPKSYDYQPEKRSYYYLVIILLDIFIPLSVYYLY